MLDCFHLDCFHQKMRKLEFIVIVAADDGRMFTQKFRRFPSNRCNLVSKDVVKLELIVIVAADDGRMSTQKCRRFPPNRCDLVSKDVVKLCWN